MWNGNGIFEEIISDYVSEMPSVNRTYDEKMRRETSPKHAHFDTELCQMIGCSF